jgi:hypothetical protein
LEALDPQVMMDDLEKEIKRVIDVDLFNAELAKERDEAVYLQNAQKKAEKALKGLDEGIPE